MNIRGFKENEGGLVKLTLTAQDEKDRAFLNQLVGQPLICTVVMSTPHLRVAITPSLEALSKPQPVDKYRDKTADDLLDMAARRGYESIPRDALREDVIQLLVAHEAGDEEAAKKIASNVRRNVKQQGSHRVKTEEVPGHRKITTSNQ